MRLHALALLAICAYATAASIKGTVPDKRDIEKKLKEVVKEVLSKDEASPPSEPEFIEQPAPVKDIENNLKIVPATIPVKVVVEDVKPALNSEGDKKENNEIPESQESDDIKREEPDLKNPGPPQRMQHDSQHPETFDDATVKAANQVDQWQNNPSYLILQKELQNLKSSVEAQIAELKRSLEEYYTANPDAVKNEHNLRLRSDVKQEPSTTSTTTTAPFWANNPLYQGWQTIQNNFQSNFGSFNSSLNEYFQNQSQNNSCGGGLFGFPSLPGLGGQQSSQGNSGAQSDEPRPPGFLQQVQQNVQNFLSGGAIQPPAGAQSDSPQTNRPVIQAVQQAIQQAGNLFSRPPVQPAQTSQPSQPLQNSQTTQTEPQKVPSEGSNVVPEETQKEKPEQAVLQSGPIRQMIGNSPVVQGIAGAVQRIGQAIIPNKPRNEIKNENVAEKDDQEKGGLLVYKPKPTHSSNSGDNNDVHGSSSGRVEVKKMPEEVKEQVEAEPAKAPDNIQKQPAKPAEQVPEKTE